MTTAGRRRLPQRTRRPRPARRPATVRGVHANSARAIGVFDSGIGGLTVMERIMATLPHEHLIYLGDTARNPYGTKSAETVRRYAFENTGFLVEKGIKALVVACNSASAVALEALQAHYDIPVLGVIDPGAREAAARSRTRRIGVIATEATIASGSYTRSLQALDERIEVYTRACPLFVPLVEEGWVDNEVARLTANLYLTSLGRSGIDTLILGCTHYPLLKPLIGAVMGAGVRLIDSAEATVHALGEVLRDGGLERREGAATASFFVTDAPERFVRIGRRFLGEKIESAVRIER